MPYSSRLIRNPWKRTFIKPQKGRKEQQKARERLASRELSWSSLFKTTPLPNPNQIVIHANRNVFNWKKINNKLNLNEQDCNQSFQNTSYYYDLLQRQRSIREMSNKSDSKPPSVLCNILYLSYGKENLKKCNIIA